MFKVICISNQTANPLDSKELEVGKIYDADFFNGSNRFNSELYKIYLVEGNYKLYFKKLFLTLAEWRNKQIDSILEDETNL